MHIFANTPGAPPAGQSVGRVYSLTPRSRYQLIYNSKNTIRKRSKNSAGSNQKLAIRPANHRQVRRPKGAASLKSPVRPMALKLHGHDSCMTCCMFSQSPRLRAACIFSLAMAALAICAQTLHIFAYYPRTTSMRHIPQGHNPHRGTRLFSISQFAGTRGAREPGTPGAAEARARAERPRALAEHSYNKASVHGFF